MTRISFANDVGALLKSADYLLVVAPKAAVKKGGLPKALPAAAASLLLDLDKNTSPGDLGAVGSTLSNGHPRKLQLGLLPDRGSRYNCPARAESIRKVVATARPGRSGKTGVLLILDDPSHAQAAVNAVGRSLPLFSEKTGQRAAGHVHVLATERSSKVIRCDAVVRETLQAARIAARLVDTPPTDMNPAALAREARALLRGMTGVTVREIRGDQLLKSGLRGVHAVGRTALEAPRVLIASYRPTGAKAGHIALVGKGVTYDTGGLHLKARGAMETMKADMGGAAAVLGAFRVLAATKVKRRLSMVLCMAENAIGPSAYKPDDILTMHSGLTVEINNTDAEGRLLLADGVSYAARVLEADTVVDAATLTGAQLIATGNLHAAVMTNDARLERLAVDAGRQSGDMVHPMPYAPEFYKQEFESPVADMRNSVKDRANAQSSCAAQFVHWHLQDTKAKWLHVDLAGPAFRDSRATGFGVALLAELVRSL